MLKFDYFNKVWKVQDDTAFTQDFLYYSSIVNLPKGLGMFIMGGTDVDENFSRRVLLFSKYHRFYEKPPMIVKRAFFPSVFSIFDSSVYVLGGQDGQSDIATCEKYNITENSWRVIKPMLIPRNGASAICFEKVIFVFGGMNEELGVLDEIEKYSL